MPRKGSALTTLPRRALIELLTSFGRGVAVSICLGAMVAGMTVAPQAMASPDGGDLLETLVDGQNNRTWNSYNIRSATGLSPVIGRPAVAAVNGTPRVYSRTTDGSLWESLPDGLNGRTWNSYPLSSVLGAPSMIGDPAVVVTPDGNPHVYAVDGWHHLWEIKIDWRNGRVWNAYDLTASTPMPGVSGTPSAVVVNGLPRIYVRTDGNELWEVMVDAAGAWHAYNLTTPSGGTTVLSDPSAVVAGGVPQVYVAGPYGHLWQTVVDGRNGRTWNSYDITSATPMPAIDGAPAAIAIAGSPRIYTTSADTHDLLETLPGSGSGTWSTSNLRSATGVPSAAERPSAIALDGQPRIYTRSPGGELWESLPSDSGWHSYDLTTATASPNVRSGPVAIVLNGVPRLYSGTVADPPPPSPSSPEPDEEDADAEGTLAFPMDADDRAADADTRDLLIEPNETPVQQDAQEVAMRSAQGPITEQRGITADSCGISGSAKGLKTLEPLISDLATGHGTAHAVYSAFKLDHARAIRTASGAISYWTKQFIVCGTVTARSSGNLWGVNLAGASIVPNSRDGKLLNYKWGTGSTGPVLSLGFKVDVGAVGVNSSVPVNLGGNQTGTVNEWYTTEAMRPFVAQQVSAWWKSGASPSSTSQGNTFIGLWEYRQSARNPTFYRHTKLKVTRR